VKTFHQAKEKKHYKVRTLTKTVSSFNQNIWMKHLKFCFDVQGAPLYGIKDKLIKRFKFIPSSFCVSSLAYEFAKAPITLNGITDNVINWLKFIPSSFFISSQAHEFA
jgi:hypothetical protein